MEKLTTAEESKVDTSRSRPVRNVWGLIPRHVAQAEGALAAVSSLCFTPELRSHFGDLRDLELDQNQDFLFKDNAYN